MNFRFLSLGCAALMLAACRPVPNAQNTPPAVSTVTVPTTKPATRPLADGAVQIDPAKVKRANALAAVVSDERSTLEQKVQACYSLELLGPSAASAAPALAEAMRGQDPIQFHAGRALIAIGPAAVPALREAMTTGPATFRYAAADVWAQIDVDHGVTADTLNDRLAHGRPIDRVEAAIALQGVRQRDVMQAILSRTKGPDGAPSPTPAKLIDSTETADAEIEKLADVALGDHPEIQVGALKLIADWGEQAGPIAPRLKPLTESTTPAVAKAAAETLRAIGEEGVLELIAVTRSRKPAVRLLAINTLADVSWRSTGNGAKHQAIMALELCLSDKAPGMRAAAADALSGYGADAIGALVIGMQGGDDTVKTAVVHQIIESPLAFATKADNRPPMPAEIEFGKLIAPDLAARIKHGPAQEQWPIVIALSNLPFEAVHAELAGALAIALDHRTSGLTVAQAADLIGQLGPAGLPALIETLGNDDEELKLIAINTLAPHAELTQNPKMISAMSAAMGSSSNSVRQQAFHWIKRLPTPPVEAMKHLYSFIAADEADAHITPVEDRVAAVEMLGRYPFDPPKTVAVLSRAIESNSSDLALAAVVALRAYEGDLPPATANLAKLLQSSHGTLQEETAKTLLLCGKDGRHAVAGYYVLQVAAPSSRTELAATVSVIADLGPEATAAVPALQTWLSDRDNTLRMEVADALGKIGPAAADAIPALTRMSDNPDINVRSAAVEALMKISPEGKQLRPALMAAVYNGDRGCAARLAARLQRDPQTPTLVARLGNIAGDDPDPGVRAAAGLAIKGLSVETPAGNR